jgi:HlyD family secretion protein
MKRIVGAFVVLVVVLAVLLTVRVRSQAKALEGPSGGSGVIEGTAVSLSSRLAARVLDVGVQEGQSVEAGQLLMRMDCAEPMAMLAEATARVEAARAQAKAGSAGAKAARRAELAAKNAARAAEAQAEALAAQRDAARRQTDRLQAMGVDVALAQLDQTGSTATGLGHQVEAARSSGEATRSQADAAAAQAEGAEAQASAADLAVRAAEAALERAQLLVAECEVKAPRAGFVDHVYLEPGELAAPGQALARIIDLSTVTASFYLPNAEVEVAKPQGRAIVVADSLPGEPFEGAIATVSRQAEFTPRNIQTRTDRDRLVFRVEVRVPNPEGRLLPGMPVTVTIPGTERK